MCDYYAVKRKGYLGEFSFSEEFGAMGATDELSQIRDHFSRYR